jgi:hypothetical protein
MGRIPVKASAAMFRENKQHQQMHLMSTLTELPPGMRGMLEQSWAETFRREVFEGLDEKPFAVLYGEEDSRPNVPVNVLFCLEVLKTGFGWTDEQMYQAYIFDLQVRYALGYENVGDGYFAIRTVYNFRNRLSQHMQKTGENLVEQAFAQITDEQIKALSLLTDKLRVDSTQIASDIRTGSRLQLLVEALGRVHRMLSECDQERYAELLGPYVQNKASQYIYRLKSGQYGERLAQIGPVMHQLLVELAADYAQEEAYHLLARVFADHFVWTDDEQRCKEAAEVSADSLQSLDDPEASYRKKQGESYHGYVSNITETCHPKNKIQLIVKVQTKPNVSDDEQMLVDALPDLVERTDVNELYTDGGYNGSGLDEALAGTSIQHLQSAIRGGHTPDGFLSLTDFDWETHDDGQPANLTCPQGQVIPVEPGRTDQRFIARPDCEICDVCSLLTICPMRRQGSQRTPGLYFNRRTFRVAQKRQQVATFGRSGNLRAAVEATVRSVKHPFRHGKVPVRGLFRVACVILASAIMVNARRLHKAATQTQPDSDPSVPDLTLFGLFSRFLTLSSALRRRRCLWHSLTNSLTSRSLRLLGTVLSHSSVPT